MLRLQAEKLLMPVLLQSPDPMLPLLLQRQHHQLVIFQKS
jgi:hypothetical protein